MDQLKEVFTKQPGWLGEVKYVWRLFKLGRRRFSFYKELTAIIARTEYRHFGVKFKPGGKGAVVARLIGLTKAGDAMLDIRGSLAIHSLKELAWEPTFLQSELERMLEWTTSEEAQTSRNQANALRAIPQFKSVVVKSLKTGDVHHPLRIFTDPIHGLSVFPGGEVEHCVWIFPSMRMFSNTLHYPNEVEVYEHRVRATEH